MERQTLLTLTAVMAASMVFCFAHDGWAVAEVSWYLCENPPSSTWVIFPHDPMACDVIGFSGPASGGSNSCFADMAMGGSPTLTIDEAQRTVQLWFQPPPPDLCMLVWAPVCGLEGQFGPLSEGNWIFFCDGTAPDPWVPPDPWQWPRFHIEFEVSPVRLEVCQPNGGEVLRAGSTYTVEWMDPRSGQSCQTLYYLDYSVDGGQTWLPWDIVDGTCSYDWVVPSVSSEQCRVRVVDAYDPSVAGSSDDTFHIYECQVPLPGDFNKDCYVNFGDYALLTAGLSLENAGDMNDLADLAEGWCLCSDPYDPNCQD